MGYLYLNFWNNFIFKCSSDDGKCFKDVKKFGSRGVGYRVVFWWGINRIVC